MKGSNSSQTIQAFGCAPANESKIVLPHVRGDHGQKGEFRDEEGSRLGERAPIPRDSFVAPSSRGLPSPCPVGPRAMGKCLGRRGSPALDPRARSMRPAARVTALIPLRHMYSLLRFPRIDALTSSATHARVDAAEAEPV